jgi:hypothetical protein
LQGSSDQGVIIRWWAGRKAQKPAIYTNLIILEQEGKRQKKGKRQIARKVDTFQSSPGHGEDGWKDAAASIGTVVKITAIGISYLFLSDLFFPLDSLNNVS